MALVVRTSADTVSLPDHGFIGEEGALRILVQITRQIRRLDVSHNLLGTDGILTLLQGLSSLRGRYSSPEAGIWGLHDVNFASNGLSDGAMEGVLGYAKKDVLLRRVYLQGNEIRLLSNIDGMIHTLNSTRLTHLSLNQNHPVPQSLIQLFDHLDTPHLSTLHLSSCDIGPEVVPSIITYLTSSRSRNLVELGLNANRLGLAGVETIIDAVESDNFGILQLGLSANDSRPAQSEEDEEEQLGSDEERERVGADRELESTRLSHQVTQRLPRILARNRTLTFRVQRAAAKCIGPARILLNAQPVVPSAEEVARQVMADISASSINHASSAPRDRPFRLLDLPIEVQYLIVRHTSGDASALSNAQWVRLRTEAEDREALRRMCQRMRIKVEQIKWGEEVQVGVRELRDEWLRGGRWDKWESEREGERRDR